MTDFDVAKLGASKLHPKTRLPQVQATQEVTGSDDESTLGELAQFGQLGVTALPYPASEDGHCEGLIARDVAGLDAALIGTRDERTASVAGEIKGGETGLHSTGPGFDSRFLCKEQSASMVVGDDTAFVVDRATETATLAVGGSVFQIGKNGILMSDPDGNFISLTGGVAHIKATHYVFASNVTVAPAMVNPVVVPGVPLPSTVIFVDDPSAPTS